MTPLIFKVKVNSAHIQVNQKKPRTKTRLFTSYAIFLLTLIIVHLQMRLKHIHSNWQLFLRRPHLMFP